MNNIATQTLIESIQNINSPDDAYDLLDKIANHYNFDYFTYARIFPRAMTRLDIVTLGNYPTEWMDRYSRNNYVLVDPAAKHCIASTLPYDWNDMVNDQDSGTRLFVDECFQFGLKKGVSIGIRGHSGHFSILSLGGRTDVAKSQSDKHRVLATLHYLLPYMHEKLADINAYLIKQTPIDTHPPLSILSMRERECLLWTAEGKTAYEIARILNIAESTVNFHLKNAVRTLDCSNKTHAAAKAVLQGLLVQHETLADRWKNS